MTQVLAPPGRRPGTPHRGTRGRRIGWLLAAVLVVAAAVVLIVMLVTNANSITAQGSVQDARTGAPVQATLTAGDHAVTAAPDGTFRMTGVDKNASVRVTARGFTPATARAAESMKLSLTPVPVGVFATDADTGQALQGTVYILGGIPIELTGQVPTWVYGIAPGDTITIDSPGYQLTELTVPVDATVNVGLARVGA